MQPTLKKVHSVDYVGAQQQQQQQQQQQLVQTSHRNAHLMHSVSIVVELAKEHQCMMEQDDASEDPDLSRIIDMNQSGGSKFRSELRGDDEDEIEAVEIELDEEEAEPELASSASESESDEDEEDGECLSSDLARKVVIVDEADKILWTRAQSAEPRLWLAANSSNGAGPDGSGAAQTTTGCSSSQCSTPLSPPPPPSPLQPRMATRPRLSSLATCSGANWINLSASSGSSSELAERGELSKLSMRRNTHHQVNLGSSLKATTAHSFLSQQTRAGSLQPKQAQKVSPARSGSAQLDSIGGTSGLDSKLSHALATKNLFQSSQAPLTASPTANKNWSQRRQSLQISLLSGISCLPSKSLTEEELRGEREFNEQVRLAKSSELNNTPQTTPVKQSAQSAASLVGCSGGEQEFKLRQSTSSSTSQKSYTSHPTTTNNQHHHQFNAIKSQQHKQQSSQRRVSFSSIDPILVQADTRTRASFALYPTEELEDKGQRISRDVFGTAFEATTTSNYFPPINKISQLSSSGEILERSRQQQQTGCMRRDHQKRHSLAFTNTSAIFSGSTLANQRKLSSESIEEDKLVESQIKQRYSRRNNSCASSVSIFTAEPMGTPTKPGIKMNDNNDNIAESRLETTVKTRMSTFSTTLGGSQDSQDPTITSSIPITQVSVGTHEKDQSKVQSIMANAKLRQEEFARLLEEHEQIVNEINRVETKMSSSQTNLQQQQETK